VIKGVTV